MLNILIFKTQLKCINSITSLHSAMHVQSKYYFSSKLKVGFITIWNLFKAQWKCIYNYYFSSSLTASVIKILLLLKAQLHVKYYFLKEE